MGFRHIPHARNTWPEGGRAGRIQSISIDSTNNELEVWRSPVHPTCPKSDPIENVQAHDDVGVRSMQSPALLPQSYGWCKCVPTGTRGRSKKQVQVSVDVESPPEQTGASVCLAQPLVFLCNPTYCLHSLAHIFLVCSQE